MISKQGFLLDQQWSDAFFSVIGDNPCCANCKFWKGDDSPSWSASGYECMDAVNIGMFVEFEGLCCRHAPVTTRNTETGYPGFPDTSFDDWCGDFQKSSPADIAMRKLRGNGFCVED
jgi:hypothetical protein